jgi:hypothetical protein
MNLKIYDIETLKCHFSVTFSDPEFINLKEFTIDEYENDLYSLVKYLSDEKIDFLVGFNNIGFDWQVLQFILDNYNEWADLSTIQIIHKIYDFSQEIISNQNYELPPLYKEKYFTIKQIDLFKLMHFDNEAKRTSLKAVEFALDFPNIEEMNVLHTVNHLSQEEKLELIGYRRNDVHATCVLYNLVRGNTEHKLYKGKDKLKLRFDLMDEFGFDVSCLSWNDVKIGGELNKLNYCKLSKIDNSKVWELKKNRKSKTGFKFKDCFPTYWKFQTKFFNDLFTKVGNTVVNLNEKQEFKFTYKGVTFVIAKGGGHTSTKPRKIIPSENQILRDCDIQSMYPNAIRKRNLYPLHLGKKWNEAYISNIDKRIEAKELFKKTSDVKYDNFQETYKLVLNGNFGVLIDRYNWQYDPFIGMCITIGSQVDIFMLVEDLMEADIQVISLNTDGVVCLMDKSLEKKYYEICKAWEIEVGNDVSGKLEFADYKSVIELSVNDYIAIKTKEEENEKHLKFKGDFTQDFEIHKNKSSRIIPIALKNYFVYNILPEETIRKHKNIYDFCIKQKASRDFHYEGVNKSTGNINKYNKLIRYYVSTEGEKLYKIKNEEADTKAPKIRECEANIPFQKIFNTVALKDNFQNYKIDYQYYINKAQKIVDKIEPKPKKLKDQLTLF